MCINKSYKQIVQDLQVHYGSAQTPDGTPVEHLAQQMIKRAFKAKQDNAETIEDLIKLNGKERALDALFDELRFARETGAYPHEIEHILMHIDSFEPRIVPTMADSVHDQVKTQIPDLSRLVAAE